MEAKYSQLKIYEIENKQLANVIVSLDKKYFQLKIEKLEDNLSQKQNISLASCYPKTTQEVGEELIDLLDIKEIRVEPLNQNHLASKCAYLPNWRAHLARHPENFQVLTILFGKEFNLEQCKLLIIEPVKPGENPLGLWVYELKGLIKKVQDEFDYFKKLDLFLSRQFHKIQLEQSWVCGENRLKFWKFILSNCFHILVTEENNLFTQIVDSLEKSISSKAKVDESEFLLGMQSFLTFVTLPEPISVILGLPKGGMDESSLQYIIAQHPSFSRFVNTVESYFIYVSKHGMTQTQPEMEFSYNNFGEFVKLIEKNFQERFSKYAEAIPVEIRHSCQHFMDYHHSEDNSIWNPDHLQVYQDMSHPISYYWIASSHNSYLTGNQYSSESSGEPYARILRQGCRCIEIDVWDGPHNKPIVTHGMTLTSSVPFEQVLITIKDNAFATSNYPLIISLENHCSLKQQLKMAKLFRKTFGRMLITSFQNQIPSPKDLKNKIIIKGKKLNQNEKAAEKTVKEPMEEQVSSKCLVTGELWKCDKKSDNWTPFLFALANKKLFYIDKTQLESNSNSLQSSASVRSKLSQTMQHLNKPWFLGKLEGDLKGVNAMLRESGTGTFLVRNGDGDNLILNIFCNNKVHNITILVNLKNDKDRFQLENCVGKKSFRIVTDLVEYCEQNAIILKEERLCRLTRPVPSSLIMKIKYGYSKFWLETTRKDFTAEKVTRIFVCSEFAAPTAKKVVGKVRAIQSYTSTESDLMSFKKGDIIKNVIKEEDGWWLGSKEGEDGEEQKLFCSSFVEEIEELECPFGSLYCQGEWKLGRKVKYVKCSDANRAKHGINYYLEFKDDDDSIRKLGSSCESSGGLKTWVKCINSVIKCKIGTNSKEEKGLKVASELSEIIALGSGSQPFSPERKERFYLASMKSVDEIVGDKVMRSSGNKFVKYHEDSLTRVYPKTRQIICQQDTGISGVK